MKALNSKTGNNNYRIVTTTTYGIAVRTREYVQVGNRGDDGQYHGQEVLCNVLAIRENADDHQFSLLASPVDNPSWLLDCYYCPHLHNEGYTRADMYCTNARTVDEKRWPYHICVGSLGFAGENTKWFVGTALTAGE